MKKFLLKGVLILSLMSLGMTITSCEKEKEEEPTPAVDVRDQYVGTWQSKDVGSFTMYHNGQSAGTVPINKTGTVEISKSGKSGLMIDGKLFTVNDNNLSADPESTTYTDSGVNLVGTATYNGKLGSNVITINVSETGTWSNSNGATGNYSGTYVRTLSK